MDPVTAAMDGPREVRLGGVSGGSAEFDASASEGPIDRYQWRLEGPSGDRDLGTGVTQEVGFDARGIHDVAVSVRNRDHVDAASLRVQVLDRQTPYDKLVFFEYPDRTYPALAVMDPSLPSNTRIALTQEQAFELTGRYMIADGLDIDASGRHVVYLTPGRGNALVLYDLVDHTAEIIHSAETIGGIAGGLIRFVQMNPAYPHIVSLTDDTRWEYAKDELLLVDLRTGEMRFFAPEPDTISLGMRHSWDPTGTRIAIERRDHDNAATSPHRIWIYEDLIPDVGAQQPLNPYRLTTEEKIDELLDSRADWQEWRDFWMAEEERRREEGREWSWRRALYAGSQGVAWSPDGEWIAYELLFSQWDPGRVLVKERADGTGSIIPLSLEHTSDASGPTWTPDGNHILFRDGAGERILRIPADGGNATDVSAGYKQPLDFSHLRQY